MSNDNITILNILKFTLNSDLSLMYKKVYLKKYINEFMNNENENEIKNIIKENNNEIYEYLFLNRINKSNYNQTIEKQKLYNETHKERLKELKRNYYLKHREEQINKSKENYRRKKELLKNANEDNN